MISRMRKLERIKPSKRRVIVSIILGLVINVTLTYFVATIHDLYSYTEDQVIELEISSDQAPKYLHDISPEFKDAYTYTPFGKTSESL